MRLADLVLPAMDDGVDAASAVDMIVGRNHGNELEEDREEVSVTWGLSGSPNARFRLT